MEEPTSERPSRVPQHLKPFFRPTLTTDHDISSYTKPPQASPDQTIELCPPHWRLPPKRSLRHKLEAIVLKDWRSFSSQTSQTPQRGVSYERPVVMRMKDSDDYITARAANPRTGLISPSIASQTPRLPETPNSPGDALEFVLDKTPPSPTPEAKARPALRRANEGRKVSGGHANKWQANENGWKTEATVSKASPKVTDTNAHAGLIASKSQPVLQEDKFVVHMPSAREPQPYAYPGYSAEQIAAFEHYKRKARQVSSEGYDQRLPNNNHQASSGSADNGVCVPETPTSNEGSPRFPARDITVVAKSTEACEGSRDPIDGRCCGGAELRAATFAPFSSPRTPALHIREETATVLDSTRKACVHNSPAILHGHRKPLASPRDPHSPAIDCQNRHATHHHYAENTPPHSCSADAAGVSGDLRQLPRVTLVHPSLARLPQPHSHRQPVNRVENRKCSLGCSKDPNNICVERCSPLSGVGLPQHRTLFDDEIPAPEFTSCTSNAEELQSAHSSQHDQTQQVSEMLLTAVISIIDTCRQIHLPALPRIGVLRILSAEDTTPQQKADALKTILSSTGQAVLLLMAIAMLWQVGSAVMHAFEMLLWPLLVPFKLLRWVVSGW